MSKRKWFSQDVTLGCYAKSTTEAQGKILAAVHTLEASHDISIDETCVPDAIFDHEEDF